MARRRRTENEYTVSEPITTTLKDGSTVTGTLWLHVSRLGSFEVEYQERRHSDHRTDYTNTSDIRAMAKVILREMADTP